MHARKSGALRRTLAAAIAISALAMPLGAGAAVTLDYSDLWFNPSESGWGANVIQQGDTLFVTLFVYGSNSQPTWFVASSVDRVGGSNSFTGTLFRTSGPYFGATSFPSSSVSVVPVGTLTFTATTSGATLNYSVDGVAVNKSVVRQTWELENIAGTYRGALSGTWANCSVGNGPAEYTATYQVAQDGASVTVREEGAATCNYTGVYSQAGRMGAIQGGGTCSDGSQQTFAASNLQVTLAGLTGNVQITGVGSSCRFTGNWGAVRRAF